MPVIVRPEDGKMLCSQGKFVCNVDLGRLISQIWQHVEQVPLHLLAISRCDLYVNTLLTRFYCSLYIPIPHRSS